MPEKMCKLHQNKQNLWAHSERGFAFSSRSNVSTTESSQAGGKVDSRYDTGMYRHTILLPARLMGQYCFTRLPLSSLSVVVVVCNAAGRRARRRSVGRHCTAGQYGYGPLGRHLVHKARNRSNREAVPDFSCRICENLIVTLGTAGGPDLRPWRARSLVHYQFFIRSTLRQSRPNKAGLKIMSVCSSVRTYVRTYVRTSVRPKKLFDFNEIWRVGRGRRVMHDGMQYDPIQAQGQGHEPFKFGNPAIFKSYLLRHLQCKLATDHGFLNYGTISKFDRAGFLILFLYSLCVT